MDASNGYEARAKAYGAARSSIGRAELLAWAGEYLAPGARILDAGCGDGWPLAEALVEVGFDVVGLDASPAMLRRYRARLPGSYTILARAEDATLEPGSFDAAIAIGLVFQLDAEGQEKLIQQLAGCVRPGGHILFTAPWQMHEGVDTFTGQRVRSLGLEAYKAMLSEAGLELVGRFDDSGGNHHLHARKPL